MMWGDGARRLDAIEREVAALRGEVARARETAEQARDGAAAQVGELAKQAELEAERARAATAVATLGHRFAALTSQADRSLAELTERVERLERPGADEQGEQLALIKSSLLSLERQLRLQGEEFTRAVTGLVAELDAVRRGEAVA
jgi:hypothetical protein